MTRPWIRWTDDIAKLRTMAKKYSTDQIAQELGRRGVSAIHMKAHELGISLRRTPAPQDANPSAVDATG
jgi:hypothetical protein